MQLMVATFDNYQELVDRALTIEGKQQQIDNRKRKYGQGRYISGAQQKTRNTPYSRGIPTTMKDTHTTEQVLTTIVAPGMAMRMEEVAARTVPTLQHQPRRI